MATPSTSSEDRLAPAGAAPAATPPEERFWHRYSPHHEFPLSTAGSAALHVLVLVVLVLGGLLASRLNGQDERPLDLGIVLTKGDGRPLQGDPGPGAGPKTLHGPEAGGDDSRPEVPPPAGANVPPLPVPTTAPNGTPQQAKTAEEPRPQPPGTNISEDLRRLSDKARREMRPSPRREPGGRPDGSPTGSMDNRQARRQLRWTLIFNSDDGADYLHQLRDLRATLAIPQADGRHLLIRDLAHPQKEVVAGLGEFPQMKWHDEKPSSVANLAEALGLRPTPRAFVAIFPPEFERRLLTIELKHFHGPEDQILSTEFRMERRNGKYEPVVIEQRRKR